MRRSNFNFERPDESNISIIKKITTRLGLKVPLPFIVGYEILLLGHLEDVEPPIPGDLLQYRLLLLAPLLLN